MNSALPIGNGELGAMFFGGIGKEEGNFTIDLIWQNTSPRYCQIISNSGNILKLYTPGN